MAKRKKSRKERQWQQRISFPNGSRIEFAVDEKALSEPANQPDWKTWPGKIHFGLFGLYDPIGPGLEAIRKQPIEGSLFMHRDFLKEKAEAEAESGNIPKALVATEHYNVFEVKTPMFTYRYALMHGVGFIWLLKQDFQLKEPFKASNGFTIFSDYVATWVEIDKTLIVRGTADTADKTQPLVIKNMARNIGLFKALDEFTVFVNKPRVDVGKYHTEMWTLISQGVTKGNACKRVAEKYGLPEPDGSCFLCWKTQLDGTGITDCKLCLLKGHWGYGAISCLHTGSYYRMWEQEKDVTLRRALAKRIADLPNSINPRLNDHELRLKTAKETVDKVCEEALRDTTCHCEELRRNNPIF